MWNRLLLDPAKQHDDLRLIRRAMRQRWEISAEMRDLIAGRLVGILQDGDDAIALKAIAEIRQMESQNQKDEHSKAVQALEQLHDQLASILDRATVGGAIVDAGGDAQPHGNGQPAERTQQGRAEEAGPAE